MGLKNKVHELIRCLSLPKKGYGDGGNTAYFFFHIVYIKLNFQTRKWSIETTTTKKKPNKPGHLIVVTALFQKSDSLVLKGYWTL